MSDRLRAAAQAALEALDSLFNGQVDIDRPTRCASAATALRTALAEQPVTEPVAWMEGPHGAIRANPLWKLDPKPPQSVAWSIPLYPHPQPEPVRLSDDLIAEIAFELYQGPDRQDVAEMSFDTDLMLARAIESAVLKANNLGGRDE